MPEINLLKKYTSGVSASSVAREVNLLEIEGVTRGFFGNSSENREASYNSEEKQFIFDCEYREIYLHLQQKVAHSLSLANNSTPTIDTWEVDVEIALMILSESPLLTVRSFFLELEKLPVSE